MTIGAAVLGAVAALAATAAALGGSLDTTGTVDSSGLPPTPVSRTLGPPPNPAPSAPSPAASRGWQWPLAPRPALVRGFDPPEQRWSAGHRGVDLAATPGQPIRSPGPGVVTYGGLLAGRGVVVVTHPGGRRSTFQPVTSWAAVGTRVSAGDTVGRVADSRGHCNAATCLHWGVLRGRVYLDPLSLLTRRPVVLLPLGVR